MSQPVRRHSTLPSTGINMVGKRSNKSMLSSPLLAEVRSPGFTSRISTHVYADNVNNSGTLDSSRPRPYFNASASMNNASILTPPPATADFNRATSCDRSFGTYSRFNLNSPRAKLPILSQRNSVSLMSPRNRRSFIPNRSASSPPPLSPYSRHTKSATASPVVTVRVAPSQPFSPFRSSIQDPASHSQGSTRHHGIPQSATAGLNVTLPSGGKIGSLTRNTDLHSVSCVQQSETGDKIDPRRVLAVLQELSRSRKRTRERDRGKRLMNDCRDHGGNPTAGDEEDDDDDEDDDDEDDDEEEEEEETGSKRARRDSSSSLGSSLSMDMPPLFSHNGVVGQTTSHLVASDHLSLNSLLSQSQSVYGHKGVLQNQSSGGPSHIAPLPVSASHGSGITNHSSQHTRSRKQKTIFNEVQASLTSSIRERKRLREAQPSDSEDDLIEDKANNLTKKKSLSAPNVVSPSSKSPNVKKARLMNRQETNDESRPVNNQTQPVKKKTVAFADISSNIPPTDISKRNANEEEGSKPPKIVLSSISDLIQNSTHPVKSNSEEDNQKPLLSNPEAINQDREQSKKRVKAMISDAFDEPDSDEEKETNKENDGNETQKNVNDKLPTSTIVTGVNFKFGDTTNKLPTAPSAVTVLPPEKSDPTGPSIETNKKEENIPVESQTPSKDIDSLNTVPKASISEKFSQAENKLPEVPSTLEIISQTVLATSTSPSASTIQTLTTANTPVVTPGSSQLTNASSISGFTFSAPTTKAQSGIEATNTSTLPTFSTAKPASNAAFTFSSKPTDIATTSPTLSSKSVLTALASPNFKATFSIPTTSTGVTPGASQKVEPVPITTNTSTTGGFQFSLGKPGVTSPITTLSGFPTTVPTTTLPSSTTSISTSPSSGGFNFSNTSTSSFSFGPVSTNKNVGAALTNTGTPVTASLASSTTTAAIPPTMTSNIFSFGTKNPPDITATKTASSAVSPFSFGKTEDKSPAPTATVPSSAVFGFGAAPPATSAHSSALTGTKPFTFDTAPGKSGQTSTSLFSFGQKNTSDSTVSKQTAASTFSFGKTEQPVANTSPFTFGKMTSPQDAPKVDSPFSFNATNNSKPTTTAPVPTSTAPSLFSFGKTESKPKESAAFSFGNPTPNSSQNTGGIFNFGNASANPTQVSAGAPRRSDTAPTAPFQFAGSTLPSSAPQKSFSFGHSGASSTSEQFKFGGTTGSTNNASTSQPTPFGATKPTGFAAANPSAPFGSTTASSKPVSANPFQFGASNTSSTQSAASGSAGGGIFSFGSSGPNSSSAPFGAASPPQNAPPAFGANNTAAGNSVGPSQSNTGFNFATTANAAVPGVFQFGGGPPPSNQQAPAPAASYSFGNAITNAPTFGATSPIGQPPATPGGNMFSIGSSGNNANTKGRTIRTATRRRPK